MAILDLLSLATPSYSGGAKATPNGVGLPKVSPLFSVWASAALDPPNGVGDDINFGWYKTFVYNGYLYAWVRSTKGTGAGLYRYSINESADPVTISYDDMVNLATLGLPAYWHEGRFQYADHETGDIGLSAYLTSAQSKTFGRWNVGDWPLADANKVWSGVPSSYGAVVADQVPFYNSSFVDATNNRVYCCGNSGKCLVFQWDDGTYLGEYQWSATYSVNWRASVLGIYPGSTDIVLGFYQGLSAGRFHRWDGTTFPWVQGSLVRGSGMNGYSLGSGVPYDGLAPNQLHGAYIWLCGLSRPDCDLLGLSSNEIAWYTYNPTFSGQSFSQAQIAVLNVSTDAYREMCTHRQNSCGRAGRNARNAVQGNIVKIGGQPWFIGKNEGTIDHYAEQTYQPPASGLAATHCGIGRVDLVFTATTNDTPKKLLFEVSSSAVDSEFSAHYGKWRAALDINGGGFTAYRAGPAELGNLDAVVNGKAAWASWTAGDTITIRVECSSGILHSFAPVQGNPGDLATPVIPVADIGPPRDVRPVLVYDASLPDQGKYRGIQPTGSAAILRPAPMKAEVV